MELASNLTWLGVSLVLLALTYWFVRRGTVRIRPSSAMMTTLLVCFLLLPVISVSDDLIEARQATLPLSAQTWHLASESASIGLEAIPVIEAALLLFLGCELVKLQALEDREQSYRSLDTWLTQSQRLRPPPALAR